jgi:hypothetical protein
MFHLVSFQILTDLEGADDDNSVTFFLRGSFFLLLKTKVAKKKSRTVTLYLTLFVLSFSYFFQLILTVSKKETGENFSGTINIWVYAYYRSIVFINDIVSFWDIIDSIF